MERVISRGTSLKIANHELQVSKLNSTSVDTTEKMKYLPAIVEKDSVSSSDISGASATYNTKEDASITSMSATPVVSNSVGQPPGNNATTTNNNKLFALPKLNRLDLELFTDKRRVHLLNVPDDIDYDYLELYLEYLSDEIEVECIDYAREMPNSIVATFVREIGKKPIFIKIYFAN